MLLKPNVKENKQTNNLISNNFVMSSQNIMNSVCVCVCTSVTKSVKSNEIILMKIVKNVKFTITYVIKIFLRKFKSQFLISIFFMCVWFFLSH